MTAAEVAALLLSIGGEVAKLAAAAIEAERAGNDQQALELLDQAITKLRDQVAQLPAALDAVKARIAQRIADKFDHGQ